MADHVSLNLDMNTLDLVSLTSSKSAGRMVREVHASPTPDGAKRVRVLLY